MSFNEVVNVSRPKPSIILNHTDPRSHIAEQVLKAEAIYAVFHNGVPINLRSIHTLLNDRGAKYKKCSFSNPGHAFNLAEKLNSLFKTDTFHVYALTAGERIEEKRDV